CYHSLCSPPPPTHLHPLSLHDALPICSPSRSASTDASHLPLKETPGRRHFPSSAGPVPLRHSSNRPSPAAGAGRPRRSGPPARPDRKSTRLNPSHVSIPYAVFCLKKKTTRGILVGQQSRTPSNAINSGLNPAGQP